MRLDKREIVFRIYFFSLKKSTPITLTNVFACKTSGHFETCNAFIFNVPMISLENLLKSQLIVSDPVSYKQTPPDSV